MSDELRRDWTAYAEHLEIDKLKGVRRLEGILGRSTFLVVALFRLSARDWPIAKYGFRLLYKGARMLSGVQIPRGTRIGGGLVLPHYGNIVINRRAVIGRNCSIFHNVTIGAKGRGEDGGAPIIGDGVFIGAGACVLGGVRLGDGCVVGANSVVVKDVASHAIVAGNPAKVIGATLSQPARPPASTPVVSEDLQRPPRHKEKRARTSTPTNL